MLLEDAVKLLRFFFHRRLTLERQPHTCSRKGFIVTKAMKAFILWLFSRMSETAGEITRHGGVRIGIRRWIFSSRLAKDPPRR